MNGKPDTSRRSFLQSTALALGTVAFPSLVPAKALGRAGYTSPGEKITLGIVGIGPRCKRVLEGMLPQKDVQVIAIADVQESRRIEGKQLIDQHYRNSDCVVYRDFRELLARTDIDAVLVATGDRWHTHVSVLAARANKDVYSEKPCGITIEECQILSDTIRQEKRVFQAGTQRRSVVNFVRAVELAQSGKLGKIHTLHASIYRPKLGNAWLEAEPSPDPKDVDWNMWLGPAPWRPYNRKYVEGRWRGLFDFDSGATLLDWGAHTVDLCQWANQSDDTMPIRYVPAEDSITAHYANGVKLVMHFLDTPFGDRPGWVQELSTCPVRFVGDEGWVEVGDSGGIVVSSPTLQREVADMEKGVSGLGVDAHARNFFDCVKSRGTTVANESVMRNSHVTCHAASISWMLNRDLKMDLSTESFINDFEANSLCSRGIRNWG